MKNLSIVACDVGQGDAILIRYESFITLIDTGPNFRVVRCLQANLFFWERNIDLLILSHLDNDHAGGLSSLEEQYDIDMIWWNGIQPDTLVGQKLADFSAKNGKTLVGHCGDTLVLPGVRLRTVWGRQCHTAWGPGKSIQEDANANSLSSVLETPSFGFFSFGDLESVQELAVNSMSLLNSASVLKVSHHGSKSSSSTEFLQKIHPETILISVGVNNSYQHPAQEVLLRLEDLHIPFFRTDQHGSIRVVVPWKRTWWVELSHTDGAK